MVFGGSHGVEVRTDDWSIESERNMGSSMWALE